MSEFIFAQTLRALLKEKKITLEKLAEYLGVSRQAVTAYSTGKALPCCDTIIKLADYFGVSCDFLLTGVEHNDRKRQGQVPAYIFINLCNDAKKLLSKMHTRAERIEENLRQLEEFEDEFYTLLFKSRNIAQQSDTQEEIKWHQED